MDFDIFSSQKNNDNKAIFDDASKVQEIKDKLCKKRLDLESQSSTIKPESLQEYTLSLIELKKDMEAFGVSEIDYQVYLAKNSIHKV
jgi:hypothetical protein